MSWMNTPFPASKIYWTSIFGLIVFCAGLSAQQSPVVDSGVALSTLSTDRSQADANLDRPSKRDISSRSLAPKNVENWFTPSLEGSDLKSSAAMVGEVDVQPGFARELTRVQWRAGDPIDLYIVKPTMVQKPPVILYLYSYPFETDRFRDNNFCRFLVQNGFAAVGFASALTGQRYHDRSMKEWFVSELPESLASSAHDVQMILNYLATRSDVDTSQVGMFGDGSGATIAILAAAVDPRIGALDLIDPWGDWPDWIAKSTLVPDKERPGMLSPEFLAAVAPLDPLQWLPKLKTPKVRIQELKSVTVTPEESRLKLVAAAPPNIQVIRYGGTKEFLNTVSGGKGLDWIKGQLRPGGALSQFRATTGHSQSETSSTQAKIARQ